MSLIPLPSGGADVPASIGPALAAIILILTAAVFSLAGPDLILANLVPDMAKAASILANLVPDMVRLVLFLAKTSPILANVVLNMANFVPILARLVFALANAVLIMANFVLFMANAVLFLANAKKTFSLCGPAGEKGRWQPCGGGLAGSAGNLDGRGGGCRITAYLYRRGLGSARVAGEGWSVMVLKAENRTIPGFLPCENAGGKLAAAPCRLLLLSVFVTFPAGCEKAQGPQTAPIQPLQVIEWTGITGFREWGQTGDGLFGTSTDDRLETWKWEKATLQKDMVAQLPQSLRVVPLPGGMYLACVDPGGGPGRWPLVLGGAGSNEVLKKWPNPAGWGYRKAGASASGQFTCILAEQDKNWDNPGYRVGVFETAAKELRWVAEWNGHGAGEARQICVSNDGRYVAFGGWKNGGAVVDCVLHKLLWAARPSEAINIGYVHFSADGETLYEADAGGECVYIVETKTGKIQRRAYLTESGTAGQGRRASCLAVSPDGVWAAAGTGPDGQVFLFRTDLPASKPVVLPHGHSTILIVSFSPDSAHVASVAGGLIKIWAVPGGGSGRPASQPASSRPSSAPEEVTATRPPRWSIGRKHMPAEFS